MRTGSRPSIRSLRGAVDPSGAQLDRRRIVHDAMQRALVWRMSIEALIGNARYVLISDLVGRSNIVMKVRELGFGITSQTPERRAMLKHIRSLQQHGHECASADGSLAERYLMSTRPDPQR